MKSLRFKPDHTLHFVDIPKPNAPGPNEVLIRMAYASICGYDIMMLRKKTSISTGGTVGHEGAGIIEAVGKNVSTLHPGDHVAINPYRSCGICRNCRSNKPQFCTNAPMYNNLMTEYVLIDQSSVYLLPPALPLHLGSLIEPLMMAMYTVSRASIKPGSSVLLFGCGSMGQLILKLLSRDNIRNLVVVDPHDEKLEKAKLYGADHTLNAKSADLAEGLLRLEETGFDYVIEASGNESAASLSPNMLSRGGTLVFLGLYGLDFHLDVNLFSLYWRDATIHVIYIPSGLFPNAISIAPKLQLDDLITAIYPFEQAPDAFIEKATGKHVKILLKFPSVSD